MCFLECLVDGATSHPWSVHENSVTLALRTKSTSMTNMASWPEHGRDADGSNPIVLPSGNSCQFAVEHHHFN